MREIWALPGEYTTLKLGIFGDLYTDNIFDISSVRENVDVVYFIC